MFITKQASSIRRSKTGPLRRLIAYSKALRSSAGWIRCFTRKPSTPPRTDRMRRRDESLTWRHDQPIGSSKRRLHRHKSSNTPWGDVGDKHSVTHAPRHIPGAQDAFKGLMIHWILQFALRIAFRCVLHRCGSQDIRR